MITIGKHEYASISDYLCPFVRRYRRLFWVDGVLAALHVPLLAFLLIRGPLSFGEMSIRVGWTSAIAHLSIAAFGVIASTCLLLSRPYAAAIAYAKSGYVVAVRLLMFFAAIPGLGRSLRSGVAETVDAVAPSVIPFFIVIFGYQGFFAWCVHLNHRCGAALNTTRPADNRALNATAGSRADASPNGA